MTAPRVERAPRRRGAFGLDDRRRPDPARVEADLRCFLAGRLPEVWPMPAGSEPAAEDRDGRTLALLLPRGHVAMLRIERDPARPGPASRALAERCRSMGIPHATVSSLPEGRAALRRLGVEPRPQAAAPLSKVAWSSPRNLARSYEEARQDGVGLPTKSCLGPTLGSVFGRG